MEEKVLHRSTYTRILFKHGRRCDHETNSLRLCQVSFHKDTVQMIVVQNVNMSHQAREQYNSAHRQCLLHMVSHQPKTFKCETAGDLSEPRTEVVLQQEILKQLPLLLDISESTSTDSQSSSCELELPCSIWGFVSLFFLLEGAVKCLHWFWTDSEPSLPAQTLLACAMPAHLHHHCFCSTVVQSLAGQN